MTLQKKLQKDEKLSMGVLEFLEKHKIGVRTASGISSLDVSELIDVDHSTLEKGDPLIVVLNEKSGKPLEVRDKENKHILFMDEHYRSTHYKPSKN